MAASVAPIPIQQWFDDDGQPLAGGQLFTYEAGTDTPVACFTDSDLTIEWSNPIVLDSAGRATGPIYAPTSVALKYILWDADDVPIWEADNVVAVEPAT